MKKIKLLILFLLLSVMGAIAQTGTIRGFIYDKNSREAVMFVNVFLKGTTIGANTDVNGYYTLVKVPPGSYTLMVTGVGYDTARAEIVIKGNEIISRNLLLAQASVKLQEVNISAEKTEATREVRTSVVKITPKEIKSIPTVGGEPDIAQYLQVLPGVIFTGDQGGQLYIRGGSPIQNKVLLDGMIVYNPFHSIGLFSVFDTDIIRNADIYTGGFNAEYGGRISSIMDIKTKDGNKTRLSGKVSASTFGAKALIEGPLKAAKEENASAASFILSAKHSYLERSSKLFYSYIDTGGLPFSFTDLYAKVSVTSPTGSKINLFGFNFNDNVRYKSVSNLGWDSYGGGTNFVLVPGGTSTLIEGNVSYSKYLIALEEQDGRSRTSGMDGFNFGINFVNLKENDELKYGMEMLGFKTDFSFINSVGRRIEQVENTTELASFVKYRINRGKFVLEPSFRAHYYASLNHFSPEPRFGLKYNIVDRIRFKFAGGKYSQNLISANSDRDVVNLFYGFLSGPEKLQSTFVTPDGEKTEITHRLQKSTHAIAGFEFDLMKNLTLNVEVYKKYFNQLTNINRNKIFDVSDASRPDSLKLDFIVETGSAEGIDFLVKYEFKRMYFWVAYSLARVTRWDGNMRYYPVFDRRHNVNFVSTYTFGKNLNWEIDVRWNLGSGFPFTPTQGFYENIQFDDITDNYVTSNGQLGIQYGEYNSHRLPYYHRLDFNLKKKWEISTNSTLEANVGATNMYNRDNIFYFDRLSYKRVNQLPLMPSAGISLSF